MTSKGEKQMAIGEHREVVRWQSMVTDNGACGGGWTSRVDDRL